MKKPKMLIFCVFAFVLFFSIAVSAMSFVGAGTTSTLNVVEAYAYFTPSYLTTSDTGYGTETGKHIKQAYVRIVENNVDSGRVYSDEAQSITDNNTYWARTSRWNNPLYTMYTNYGWVYFN